VARDRVMVDMRGLGPRIRQHCTAQGITLADFIAPMLADAVGVPRPARKKAAPKEQGGRRKLSVFVDLETYDGLDAVAEPAGLSVAGLVGRLAAEHAGKPTAAGPTQDALAALVRSNYELRAIGRNINQIAHSLNAFPGKITASERNDLVALAGQIDSHVRLSAGVLQSLKPARAKRARSAA
jgi:hypothetical protein